MSEKIRRLIDQGQKALRRQHYEEAGAKFEAAAALDANAHAAWFGLGEVALGIGQAETARTFLAHAVALSPKRACYHQRLGECCGRLGALEEGIAELKTARRLAPNDAGILLALSGLYVKARLWGHAKTVLQALIRKEKPQAGHYCLLGLALQYSGELDAALRAFRKAVCMDARNPEAWMNLGYLQMEKGAFSEAEACLEKLFVLAPKASMTLSLAGDAEMERRNFQVAAKFYREAQEEAADSAAFVLHLKLAFSLVASGDTLAAIDAMEAAHAAGANEDWIYEQLGMMFEQHGNTDAARENFELAVERNPKNLNAWNVLILIYNRQGESEKAWQAAKAILSRDPNHQNGRINLATWYGDQARNAEAIPLLREALAVEPERPVIYTNLLWTLVHSSEVSAQDVLETAREFDRNLCQRKRRADDFHDRDRAPERRLRIGWLSSDLNNHPVMLFVYPFYLHLDRAQAVENFVYFNSMRRDAMTELLKVNTEHWRDVMALGDDRLADLIREDEIDILIDLNGNTQGGRQLMLARKPAPIQVGWLGFPGTSGMSAMDYILVPPDPVLEASGWSAETPWPLPDCYGVRSVADYPDDVPVLPGLPCEREGKPFTFACFNNFRKASQKALDLWARILLRVPESRLILVARGGRDGTMVEYVEAQFRQRGVAADRLELRGFCSRQAFFEQHNEADLCLDPFPFNGGTTGYDGIWMGVPFVTLPGDMLVARMGKAILENVGLHELVAADADAYVDIAVALARDHERLKRLRAGLRERMLASPLMDSPRMARSLEQAFRGMWRRWLAEHPLSGVRSSS
ncbi:MAG: tetratricopeptide repeat protein [Zoogloeaceae bacterium]|jgi:predicted O-linked N-acetylglucosamine transferase (SPINDLY family)|nr:tetratricopeptide repeat protein [Zoogloeaceae bacterium]